MLIKNRNSWDLKSTGLSPSDITPKSVFKNRRKFMTDAAKLGLSMGVATGIGSIAPSSAQAQTTLPLNAMKSMVHTLNHLGEKALTPYEAATQYNNFYEFGTGKTDPYENAQDFEPTPWAVSVDGAVGKPGVYDFNDLVSPHQLEERVYRFRCVEAWSMVVPWVGVQLSEVIKRLEPSSSAKYVAFETLHDEERMPGQGSFGFKWPYVEGLRMDEAMNPLTLLSTGMYGETLPNQNGAPIRLITPWKYGFKSIKSIVRISFVEEEPPTTWNIIAPREYGFYSNVNPEVSHPRWSQAKERRVGDGIFDGKIETLMFNGYEADVAHLYKDMDLKKNF